ncbi:MAG: hypothetical protein D6754_14260 [Alphaproteobacteria bacterium]|nr:MAG: hypothetical protein D6754_14260 [Alphaproteobacteria bacterium]
MKLALSILLGLIASAAAAHPGHIGTQNGHDHILALVLVILAALIGVAVLVRQLMRRAVRS